MSNSIHSIETLNFLKMFEFCIIIMKYIFYNKVPRISKLIPLILQPFLEATMFRNIAIILIMKVSRLVHHTSK